MLDLIAASSQVRIREICTTVTMRKRQDEHGTKDKVSSPILKKLILFTVVLRPSELPFQLLFEQITPCKKLVHYMFKKR